MFNIFNIIAAGSAIFLAFLVVTVRRDANANANRWLGVFLFFVGLFILDDSLLIGGIYQTHPRLFGILNLLLFAMAPPLYLTVSQFVSADRRFRGKDAWHFLPALMFLILSLPFLLSSDTVKLQEMDALDGPLTTSDKVLLSIVMLQMGIYIALSFRKLSRYRLNLGQVTASPRGIGLDWLWYCLWCVAGMVLIWMIELFVFTTKTYETGWYPIAYLTSIYALGFFALRQKEVFPYSKTEAKAIHEIMEENETPPAARKSLFSEEKLNTLKAVLLEKMQAEKPYLDPELNLPSLARQMDLSVHEMSELINMGFGENFAQFVNRHRVEESKKLLFSEKHTHLNMVGIAFEAGFNSKTAFNTVFKKMVGLSPTAFRENGK
jgi:AraC-like DNA-binding protein